MSSVMSPTDASVGFLRRAVEFARELPGMIARRAQELRHGLRHSLDRGPRLGL